jgi:hypothetical protein
MSHCSANGPEYPLSILGRHRTLRDTLIAQGYRDLRDIPEEAIGDGRPRQLWEATLAGRVSVDTAAATLLRGLGYPRYYLDFETIQFAVPIWAGTRPYEQLPFQWACTVEHENGSIEHREFLDISGAAPMRACAEALIAALGTEGPVFAYTGFEARIIGEAAARYSDLAPQLYAIIGRIVDLHELARSYYYHPTQKGSWSLKAVVPTIAPELDYGALSDVADGTSAQLAYFEIIDPATPEQRKRELIDALRVYCRRDTEAMVRLVGKLEGAKSVK